MSRCRAAGAGAAGLASVAARTASGQEPPTRARSLGPLRAVLVLDIEPARAPGEERDPAPIIPFEPALSADEALSFDWNDEPRRLRKSA
jgi:hypothetical protein